MCSNILQLTFIVLYNSKKHNKTTKIKVDEIVSMDFCKDCDGLLQPRKDEQGNIGSFCMDCGEFKDGEISVSSITIPNEARDNIENDPEGGKMLILEDNDNRTVGRSSKEMYCSNCKSNQQVEYWEIQTRSADESPTRFFKCLNCEKQWREYD